MMPCLNDLQRSQCLCRRELSGCLKIMVSIGLKSEHKTCATKKSFTNRAMILPPKSVKMNTFALVLACISRTLKLPLIQWSIIGLVSLISSTPIYILQKHMRLFLKPIKVIQTPFAFELQFPQGFWLTYAIMRMS